VKLKYFIPSLLAAGFLPANSAGVAALPRPDSDDAKALSLFDIFKQEHKYNLAAHRSHSSHGSHRSHRSSSGGSYGTPSPRVNRAPSPPAPSRNLNSTPPLSILPSQPAAPKPLPGNTEKFKAIVVQLQTCLSLFGYYSGVLDGVVGPETAAAISKFQEQWDFPITGTVTPQVLDACGIAAL
jgi:His-Xaa-Ser repeat protein HxsA